VLRFKGFSATGSGN